MKTIDDVKVLARSAVERIRQHKRVFKYLTYDSGIKMLLHNNLQFTRADYLNDDVDCHISKVNFNYVVDTANSIKLDPNELVSKVIDKHKQAISSFGICSLGTTSDNIVLWERYTETDKIANGICIELDISAIINCFLKKANKKVAALIVDYVDKTSESIPYELFLGNKNQQFIFFQSLFATKTIPWESEQELRIILPEELEDSYIRTELYKSCFKGIYLGKDITLEQKNEISKIIHDSKYKIKTYSYDHTTKTI